MLIPVIYPDGKYDMVKDTYLSYLIKAEKIDKFKRAEGWISIYAPNVRGKNSNDNYTGEERRVLHRIETNQNSIEKASNRSDQLDREASSRAQTIYPPHNSAQRLKE